MLGLHGVRRVVATAALTVLAMLVPDTIGAQEPPPGDPTTSTTTTTTSVASPTTTTTTVPDTTVPASTTTTSVASPTSTSTSTTTTTTTTTMVAAPAVVEVAELAAASMELTALSAGSLFRPGYSDVIYEVVDGVPRAITFAEWEAAGFPPAAPAPTSYLKYAWSPSIYAVTKWRAEQAGWQWDRLTFAQWDRAGRPTPSTTDSFLPGTGYFRWETAGEIFAVSADGFTHKLTGSEWAAAGSPAPQLRANEGYLKLSWAAPIYRMSNLAGTVGTQIGYDAWRAADFPTPRLVSRLPGDRFTQTAGSSAIFYSSSLMSRQITYGEWLAAGSPAPIVTQPTLPGSGRRVVYSRSQQRVWAIDSAGTVVKTHAVSGRLYEPYAGTYSVYSRSLYTYSTDNPDIKFRYMVRFTYGPGGGRIGFHEIPTKFGVPLQSTAQLGQPLSGGCVRQSTPDAQWMWDWAGIGTKVVVT